MYTATRCGLNELSHLRKTVTCVHGGKLYYVHDVIKIWTEITKLTVLLLRTNFLFLLPYEIFISLDN